MYFILNNKTAMKYLLFRALPPTFHKIQSRRKLESVKHVIDLWRHIWHLYLNAGFSVLYRPQMKTEKSLIVPNASVKYCRRNEQSFWQMTPWGDSCSIKRLHSLLLPVSRLQIFWRSYGEVRFSISQWIFNKIIYFSVSWCFPSDAFLWTTFV